MIVFFIVFCLSVFWFFGVFCFITQNFYICQFSYCLSVMLLSVEVGRYGRIVLPKHIRKKYGLDEGIRLIITEHMGNVCLVPVKTYKKPTDALYGSVKFSPPVDEPKEFARQHVRKKLFEEFR